MNPHLSSDLEQLHALAGGSGPYLAPAADAAEMPGTAVSHSSPPLRRILVVVDVMVIVAGWLVTVTVAAPEGVMALQPAVLAAHGAVTVAMGALLLSASGLYRRRICAVRRQEVARTGWASAGLAVVTWLWLLSVAIDRALAAAAVGGAVWFALLVIERGLFREWINVRRATGDFAAPVLVVGGSDIAAARLATFLSEHPVLGFEVRGLALAPAVGLSDIVRLHAPSELARRVETVGASGAFVDAGSLTGDELHRVVRELTDANLHVHITSGFQGVDRRRVTLTPFADETLLHIAPTGLSRGQAVIKRAIDVVVASVVLLVMSPLLLVSAIAIWGHDRGPVLFRQERVGQGGERFMLFKLRTMVVDAESRRAELELQNGRSGPLFKLARDPRVTPFGRFLRASSIDELPQLLNVLEGAMSLVGPRPALPSEVEQFDEALRARMNVKPGMTGLWQVEARDLPSFELYRRYDLMYVRNWSVASDLSIIARTFAVVGLRTCAALVPHRVRRRTAVALE
jgi:exopolysaccharide biosynthesis polyprenyl glycosylphosphotransferase